MRTIRSDLDDNYSESAYEKRLQVVRYKSIAHSQFVLEVIVAVDNRHVLEEVLYLL